MTQQFLSSVRPAIAPRDGFAYRGRGAFAPLAGTAFVSWVAGGKVQANEGLSQEPPMTFEGVACAEYAGDYAAAEFFQGLTRKALRSMNRRGKALPLSPKAAARADLRAVRLATIQGPTLEGQPLACNPSMPVLTWALSQAVRLTGTALGLTLVPVSVSEQPEVRTFQGLHQGKRGDGKAPFIGPLSAPQARKVERLRMPFPGTALGRTLEGLDAMTRTGSFAMGLTPGEKAARALALESARRLARQRVREEQALMAAGKACVLAAYRRTLENLQRARETMQALAQEVLRSDKAIAKAKASLVDRVRSAKGALEVYLSDLRRTGASMGLSLSAVLA